MIIAEALKTFRSTSAEKNRASFEFYLENKKTFWFIVSDFCLSLRERFWRVIDVLLDKKK